MDIKRKKRTERKKCFREKNTEAKDYIYHLSDIVGFAVSTMDYVPKFDKITHILY